MKTGPARPFQLPPLILHPFSSPSETSLLIESSRANLALQGLIPRDDTPDADLDARLLRGRYAELRMLFYIGKDIQRWAEQCAETTAAAERFAGRQIRPEHFSLLLVQYVPLQVRTKLESWGVLDFCALFRRSFGLHAVLEEMPPAEAFTLGFLRRYHRFLDTWYEQRLREFALDRPDPAEFTFDLFASGEYSKMLEESWTTKPTLPIR